MYWKAIKWYHHLSTFSKKKCRAKIVTRMHSMQQNEFFDAEIISQTFELVLKQILRNFKIYCKYCFKKVCGQKIQRNMRHQRIQHCSNTLWPIECLKWNLILCKNIYMLLALRVVKFFQRGRIFSADLRTKEGGDGGESVL